MGASRGVESRSAYHRSEPFFWYGLPDAGEEWWARTDDALQLGVKGEKGRVAKCNRAHARYARLHAEQTRTAAARLRCLGRLHGRLRPSRWRRMKGGVLSDACP